MEFLRRWVLKRAGFARVVTGRENKPGREIGGKKKKFSSLVGLWIGQGER